MFAATDFFLMPSRFEPCGLTQMYAQRFGSLPIAYATGGLADTIADGETGFLYHDYSSAGLARAIRRAFDAHADEIRIRRMRQEAQRRDFGWAASAAHYADVYRRAMRHARAPARPYELLSDRGSFQGVNVLRISAAPERASPSPFHR